MASRREFLGALATSVASTRLVRAAPSDRVRVAFIGVGLIGTRHLIDFAAQPDVDVVAISDLSPTRLEAARARLTSKTDGVADFRRVLDRQDVDAVVVSTPDHWHALMTMMACAAGKDVYVEKPLTHSVREGDWMIAAADHHRRVVQVGTQQRSGRHYQRAADLIRRGHLGDLRHVHIRSTRNIVPGFVAPLDEPALTPDAWEMWLGPAPMVPFDPRRALYHFRWYWDYSGGQTTNLLSHDLDIVQWITGAMPTRVTAFAQRRSLEGFGETPDAFEAIYEFPKFLLTWSNSEVSAGRLRGLELSGTSGTMAINRAGFEIIPDREIPADEQIPRVSFAGAAPREAPLRTEAIKDDGYEQVRDQFVPHVRNFIESIRSRRAPISDLHGAQRTSTACHLANIAMRVGRVVRWDEAANDIVGDPEASRLLTRSYREPWDKERRAILTAAKSQDDSAKSEGRSR
ncbi:MAG TPA: Gfo/Idh/MocA family oxidoreductase [Luteitalea sp.]|nr:Gfo/Idh/MocA family oxidoreductase [Luteitalea sp.]